MRDRPHPPRLIARGLLKTLRFAALLAAGCILAASAQAGATAPKPCPNEGVPARVTAVLDGLDLTLDDGRMLRLAGIDPARATQSRPTLGEDARASLARWLVGRSIQVQILATAPDRWNRLPALAFASATASSPASDAPWSVAQALLDAGWARAKPDAEIHSCFAAFLASEAKARAAGLGLWADPYYAIVDADDRNGLAERTGAMTIVEGRFHLHGTPRRTVVTLGRGPWGLVARIATRGSKAPRKGGTDLQGLAGAQVRVRGFLDDRFGLRIDLASGDQIETLEPSAGGPRTLGQSAAP